MSHWAEIQTVIQDKYCLHQTLEEMGYTLQHGKQVVTDYYHQKRSVDLTLKELPRVGFIYEDNKINLIADFFGLNVSQKDFTSNLNQLYTKNKIISELAPKGFTLSQSSKTTNGNLQLVLQRW